MDDRLSEEILGPVISASRSPIRRGHPCRRQCHPPLPAGPRRVDARRSKGTAGPHGCAPPFACWINHPPQPPLTVGTLRPRRAFGALKMRAIRAANPDIRADGREPFFFNVTAVWIKTACTGERPRERPPPRAPLRRPHRAEESRDDATRRILTATHRIGGMRCLPLGTYRCL